MEVKPFRLSSCYVIANACLLNDRIAVVILTIPWHEFLCKAKLHNTCWYMHYVLKMLTVPWMIHFTGSTGQGFGNLF